MVDREQVHVVIESPGPEVLSKFHLEEDGPRYVARDPNNPSRPASAPHAEPVRQAKPRREYHPTDRLNEL